MYVLEIWRKKKYSHLANHPGIDPHTTGTDAMVAKTISLVIVCLLGISGKLMNVKLSSEMISAFIILTWNLAIVLSIYEILRKQLNSSVPRFAADISSSF